MASAQVQALLKAYPSLKFDAEKHKVACCFTKHEMPATVAAIESYVKGKKFKNASVKQTYDYDQHKPHIVPSLKKKHQHELFCTLTLRHISKTPQDVERHVKGKRFQRALSRWKKCQETGEKFVPRRGGRQPAKTAASDSDSAGDGDNIWSDDNEDGIGNDSDDMSDLYPAEDFDVSDDEAGDNNEDNNVEKSSHMENRPPILASSEFADSGSDSDYDMRVLHIESCNDLEVKASSSSSQSTKPSQLSESKKQKERKKKKKKRQATEMQNGNSKKTKKQRVT